MTKKVKGSLRVMTDRDLSIVRMWRNHPDVRRFLYTRHEISEEEHFRWFELASRDPKRHLLIFDQDSVPAGFMNLHQIAAGGIADWGFYVSPDAPKGTGSQMGASALDYAFTRAGLHKVCGQVLANNERSLRFHMNHGFHREGVLRDHYFDGNQYLDVVCFGLLEKEWQIHR